MKSNDAPLYPREITDAIGSITQISRYSPEKSQYSTKYAQDSPQKCQYSTNYSQYPQTPKYSPDNSQNSPQTIKYSAHVSKDSPLSDQLSLEQPSEDHKENVEPPAKIKSVNRMFRRDCKMTSPFKDTMLTIKSEHNSERRACEYLMPRRPNTTCDNSDEPMQSPLRNPHDILSASNYSDNIQFTLSLPNIDDSVLPSLATKNVTIATHNMGNHLINPTTMSSHSIPEFDLDLTEVIGVDMENTQPNKSDRHYIDLQFSLSLPDHDDHDNVCLKNENPSNGIRERKTDNYGLNLDEEEEEVSSDTESLQFTLSLPDSSTQG